MFVGSTRNDVTDVETITNPLDANGGSNHQNDAGANNYNLLKQRQLNECYSQYMKDEFAITWVNLR